MAPNEYLFVNKHLNSPSLSRNTGSEAALASKVNKHVQQQRFWKTSGPRKNWYRPFVRSESSSPSGSQSSAFDEVLDFETPRSSTEHPPTSPRRCNSSKRSSRTIPRSKSQRVVSKKDSSPSADRSTLASEPPAAVASRPGDSIDPFGITVLQMTPTLREIVDKYMQWATASSISNLTVREGIRWVFQIVLTNPMHTMAFLAAATAHERKADGFILPQDHSPEFYSYRGTRMVREYIKSSPNGVDPYVFVDIYRLGLCEWISGSYEAARIHFAYVAQNYVNYKPQTNLDWHHFEIMSTADLLFAIDVDEPPLMALCWEPDLPAGPYADSSPDPTYSSARMPGTNGRKLMQTLAKSKLPLKPILQRCLNELESFSNFSQNDFASAVSGPLWVMKRRIQGTIHRLQSIETTEPSIDDCIRRSVILILFLATTTPARRVCRTRVAHVAGRLRTAMLSVEAQRHRMTGKSTGCPRSVDDGDEPGLWLWMYITGLAAAKEEPVQPELLQWFTKRAMITSVHMFGSTVGRAQLDDVLADYLTFQHAHGSVADAICLAVRSGSPPGLAAQGSNG